MKKVIIFQLFLCFGLSSFAQEEASTSSLSDLMNVAPVEIQAGEEVTEALEKYQKFYDAELSKLDKTLGTQTSKFSSDVSKNIEQFNKILAKGDKRSATIEKQKVLRTVTNKSNEMYSNKKSIINQFQNKVFQQIKKLPLSVRVDKEMEMRELCENYKNTFAEEFKTNQNVIKDFRKTKHIIEKTDSE